MSGDAVEYSFVGFVRVLGGRWIVVEAAKVASDLSRHAGRNTDQDKVKEDPAINVQIRVLCRRMYAGSDRERERRAKSCWSDGDIEKLGWLEQG